MPTFEDDWIAFPHPVGILDALATIIAERNIPTICTSQVLAGEQIALDYVFETDDCDSMAWCRTSSVFPSVNFPGQDGTPNDYLLFATTIELGVVRAFVVPDNAEPATEEQQYEATRLAMADMAAMLQAICSYCNAHEIPVLIGTYAPLGPQGGVLGGTWTATLAAVH